MSSEQEPRGCRAINKEKLEKESHLGGTSSCRNLLESSARRFISISVLGKLRSWKEKCLIVTISLTDQQRVEEKLCKAEVAVPEHYVSRDLYNLPKTKKIFQSISQKN